jgi:hypothetical protein
MMPGLRPKDQHLSQQEPVKPASADQKLSGILSNHPGSAVSERADDFVTSGPTSQLGVREPYATSARHEQCARRTERPAHPSNRLVAQLNESWRVVDDPLQWILQRKKGNPRKKNSGWRGRSFCRTRGALLGCVARHCGEIDANALAKLKSLPDWHPDWDCRDDLENLDVHETDQAQADAHCDLLISKGSEGRDADSELSRISQSSLY